MIVRYINVHLIIIIHVYPSVKYDTSVLYIGQRGRCEKVGGAGGVSRFVVFLKL